MHSDLLHDFWGWSESLAELATLLDMGAAGSESQSVEDKRRSLQEQLDTDMQALERDRKRGLSKLDFELADAVEVIQLETVRKANEKVRLHREALAALERQEVASKTGPMSQRPDVVVDPPISSRFSQGTESDEESSDDEEDVETDREQVQEQPVQRPIGRDGFAFESDDDEDGDDHDDVEPGIIGRISGMLQWGRPQAAATSTTKPSSISQFGPDSRARIDGVSVSMWQPPVDITFEGSDAMHRSF